MHDAGGVIPAPPATAPTVSPTATAPSAAESTAATADVALRASAAVTPTSAGAVAVSAVAFDVINPPEKPQPPSGHGSHLAYAREAGVAFCDRRPRRSWRLRILALTASNLREQPCLLLTDVS